MKRTVKIGMVIQFGYKTCGWLREGGVYQVLAIQGELITLNGIHGLKKVNVQEIRNSEIQAILTKEEAKTRYPDCSAYYKLFNSL